MDLISRYWHICRISLKSERTGYEYRLVPIAEEFCTQKVPNSQAKDMQTFLLSCFNAKNSASFEVASRAEAGFCLRCYVSEPILKACQKIDSLFAGDKSFSYKDLLPFVLNDDAKTPIILDSDRKSQLLLDEKGQTKTSAFKFFTVEVLRTYDAESRSSMSLDNWVYLQTKQNSEVKDFLSEFGFQHLSDWALINRARPKQLERLSVRDRSLVEVFHAVYRRDRQKQSQGAKRCPDPSATQLQEMLLLLQQKAIATKTPAELTRELKILATQLRQYDIWSYREPLEVQDVETGNYTTRRDLPNDSQDELDVEQREILEFLHEQLKLALVESIKQEISDRLTELQKSRKYAPLAHQFIPGLLLYYCEGMSLKDIVPKLGMSSWDQARRILNPGELLSKVRTRTLQLVIEKTLEKARVMGLTEIPPKLEYLKTIIEQIEAFADGEIFQKAAEEIRAGKNRSFDSLYAQELRLNLRK